MSGLLMRPVWPLDLMLCADRSQSKARIERCIDPSGFSQFLPSIKFRIATLNYAIPGPRRLIREFATLG